MKNHSIILVMALIAAGGASAMETATIAGGSDTKQLLGGTIYTVSGDVSVSVGAAFWDRENPGPDILKDADKALLQMKQNGKLGCRIYGE